MLTPQNCPAKSSLFMVAIAAMLTLGVGCDQSDTAVVGDPTAREVAGTVQLEIDFQSDRNNIKVDVPYSSDATVFSILSRARDLGELEFESRGEDEATFVNSIGGVDNQLAAGDNWVYRVNDQLGDKSCGVFSVKPGDQVLWVFGKYP